jgi:signal peptidase
MYGLSNILGIGQMLQSGAGVVRLITSGLVLTAAGGALVVTTTGALFTDSAVVPANSFTTGTLDVNASPTSAVFNVSSMAPGDVEYAPLTISNGGSLALRYALSSSTTENTLAAQLDLRIKTGVSTCDASGFNSGTTVYGAGDLGSTTGVDLIGAPTTGAQTGDRTLAASASESLCFKVSLPLASGMLAIAPIRGLRDMQHTQPVLGSAPRLPKFRIPSLRKLAKTLMFIAMGATLTVSVLVAAATFIPSMFGLKTMVVTSGSMQPYLDPGDVALVRSAHANEVAIGDAISYYRPDGQGLITHRVVDMQVLNGVVYFQTKGDNNLSADANLTPANALFGIVDGRLPKIGFLLQKVTTNKLIRLLTLSIPVLVIAGHELRNLSKLAKEAGAKKGLESVSQLDLRDERRVTSAGA